MDWFINKTTNVNMEISFPHVALILNIMVAVILGNIATQVIPYIALIALVIAGIFFFNNTESINEYIEQIK